MDEENEKRIILYQRVFNSPDGKAVLEDFKDRVLYGRSGYSFGCKVEDYIYIGAAKDFVQEIIDLLKIDLAEKPQEYAEIEREKNEGI